MDLFKRIQDLSAVYDDDGPSAMVPESRPMFNERMQFDGGGTPLQKLRQEIVESMKPYAPGDVTEDQLQLVVKDITLDMTAEEAQASALSNFRKLFGMADGGRAGYEDGGMLVKPSDDGSRPGYKGRPGEYDRGSFTENQQKKIKNAFPEIKFDFLKQKYGVPVYNKPGKTGGVNKDYTKVLRFINQGYKIKEFKTDLLKKPMRELVMGNFELPQGVDKWNFDKYKYGIPGTGTDGENMNLGKRISKYIKEKPSWTLAADRSTSKGWMLASMERVYNNEIKNKTKNLTYEPVFKTINNKKIIVGFTDNTKSGKGKTYFGLKKHETNNSTSWTKHNDYKNVSKFVDISKRSLNEPNEVLTKLLKKKGINQALRLNDILNFDRYFETLNKTTPKELLKNAVVKHHMSGVGGKNKFTTSAATKDLQLLTAATNSEVRKFENKLKTQGFLSPEDNLALKNLGASIKSADGKLYGGGSKTAIGGFKAIEKQAEEMIKKDTFTVKNINKYLEQLGCGKAAGGRILMNNGGATLTKCAIKGQQKLNLGLTNGFDKTEGELAKRILQAGRGMGSMFALRNILGPTAVGFTVAAEAGLVGYDMLSKGKSFKEAVGDSLFNYALGDKTQIDNKKLRYQGYKDAGVDANQIGKISAYENAIDEMNNTFGEFNEENRLYNIAVNQKGKGRIPEQRFQKIKQQQAENFYNQADKNKALIQDLAKTQTEDKLDKAIDPMVPALMSDADAKRKAMQMTKPSTVAFGNFMDTVFPKGFLSDTTFKEDRDKAVNYMPAVQEYYRGNQFAGGGIAGLSGGDPEGAMTRSMNPDSQGLQGLFNRVKKV